jgi:hypothetical protein
MGFIGVPDEHQIFIEKPSQERMDISQPVCRVDMTFVRLEREIDPEDVEKKKKIVKSRQEETLNSCVCKVSTQRHPLAKNPLIKGGSPDAEWCDKNTAVIQAIRTLTNLKHYQDAKENESAHSEPFYHEKAAIPSQGYSPGYKGLSNA